jgi:hypothetical protein
MIILPPGTRTFRCGHVENGIACEVEMQVIDGTPDSDYPTPLPGLFGRCLHGACARTEDFPLFATVVYTDASGNPCDPVPFSAFNKEPS